MEAKLDKLDKFYEKLGAPEKMLPAEERNADTFNELINRAVIKERDLKIMEMYFLDKSMTYEDVIRRLNMCNEYGNYVSRSVVGTIIEHCIRDIQDYLVHKDEYEMSSADVTEDNSIIVLHLPKRAYRALRHNKINTISDLIKHSEEELKDIYNIRDKSLKEIMDKLEQTGFKLTPHAEILSSYRYCDRCYADESLEDRIKYNSYSCEDDNYKYMKHVRQCILRKDNKCGKSEECKNCPHYLMVTQEWEKVKTAKIDRFSVLPCHLVGRRGWARKLEVAKEYYKIFDIDLE